MKKDPDNTERLIKKLKKCQELLRPEEIEYEFIEKIIRSLKRKIEMGENPYKFKSNSSLFQGDNLNSFFDEDYDDFIINDY